MPHYKTLIPETHEDSIDEESNNNSTYKIYTNGSGHNSKIGASAVLYKQGKPQELQSLSYHLGNATEHITFEAEAVGAILAMWILRNIPSSSHTTISLYTDSQAFLRSIMKCANGPSRYLVEAFHTAANKLPNLLQLKWISGHSEVKGNERADELAKSATQGLFSPPTDLPPLLCQPLPCSATAEKQAYTSELNSMWLDQC